MGSSQINQDKFVLDFYKHKRDGYFIEIGAYDGVTFSNTYVLEKDYGWTGILSEVIPSRFKDVLVNRPNCHNDNDAVYSKSNLKLTFDVAGMLSGISQHILAHKHEIKDIKTQITVNTITLTDLLIKYNAPAVIDYMSLDTEGSELEILKGLDFSRYTIGYIDVEHNYIQPMRNNIKSFLEMNGYKFLRENHFDDTYIHKGLVI